VKEAAGVNTAMPVWKGVRSELGWNFAFTVGAVV